MNGILPLYKPKGMTSHDCVMKIRRLLHMKKIGHTGTLDPEVEGVLPICIGEATKIIPFLVHLKKEYVATVSLGATTTTEDSYGDIVLEEVVTSTPTKEEIDSVLQGFTGTIKQTPPLYSAIRVDGKRLYEYARENIPVERPMREVIIHNIELMDSNRQLPKHEFQIKVRCSKGTYIRTLCVDIGEALGYPAHMSYLIRTESDTFTLEETVTFDDIENAIELHTVVDLLQSFERCVEPYDAIELDEESSIKVLQGQKFDLPETMPKTSPFKMMYEGKLLAMYDVHPAKANEIKPVRVFNTYKE